MGFIRRKEIIITGFIILLFPIFIAFQNFGKTDNPNLDPTVTADSSSDYNLYGLKVNLVIQFPQNDYYGTTIVMGKAQDGVVSAVYFKGTCGRTAEIALANSDHVTLAAFSLEKIPFQYNGLPTYRTSPNEKNDRCNIIDTNNRY